MKNYTIIVNGKVYDVAVEEGARAMTAPMVAPVVAAPVAAPVVAPVAAPAPAAAPVAAPAEAPAAPAPAVGGTQGSVAVNAPMPGKILGVKVSVGQAVKKGEVLVVLEAMKMENEIVASQDGTVASVNVSNGEQVESGAVLVTLN